MLQLKIDCHLHAETIFATDRYTDPIKITRLLDLFGTNLLRLLSINFNTLWSLITAVGSRLYLIAVCRNKVEHTRGPLCRRLREIYISSVSSGLFAFGLKTKRSRPIRFSSEAISVYDTRPPCVTFEKCHV